MKKTGPAMLTGVGLLGRESLAVVLACFGMWFFSLFQLQGCAPSRDFTALEIRNTRPMLKRTVPESEQLKVAVVPFEDRRDDTRGIGTRRDWLGISTTWTVVGDYVGDMIAEVVVDHLKRSFGWQAWIVRPGILQPDGGADITITGTILAFEATVGPAFGDRNLSVTTHIRLNASETVHNRSISEAIEDTVTHRVFWFEPRDLEYLINSTLRKQMDRFRLQLHDHGLVRSEIESPHMPRDPLLLRVVGREQDGPLVAYGGYGTDRPVP